MNIIYKKLVRDNIPDICIANNQTPKYRILSDKDYTAELKSKLKEETKEYLQSSDIEELADILEVVEDLANASGSSFDELMNIKKAKAERNGKFEKKYFLESVKK